MRLYIPNGSVASGRFISPRRRCRGGKYRSSGEDDFFAPEPEREVQPTVPGLSFPMATDKGIIFMIPRYIFRDINSVSD